MPEQRNGSGAQARAHLQAAARAQERAREAAARSRPRNGTFLCLLGAFFGCMSLAVSLTVHTSPAGLILAIAGALVFVQAISIWRERTRRAAGTGWGRRSAWAVGATAILYGLGVFLAAFQVLGPWLWFWLPYAVLVALPAAAAGLRDVRAR